MGQQRRYPRPPKPPITLGELRAGNVPLSASCPICHRGATFEPHAIDVPDTTTVEDMTRRLRCTGCGRKGGMSVCPDGEAWVWYLRRTGQRDRLPWYQCFVRDE